VENYNLKNAFVYGRRLNLAFKNFQKKKKNAIVWVDQRCKVKRRRPRQPRAFYKAFRRYPKILVYKFPSVWFVTLGKHVLNYLAENEEQTIP